MELLCLNRDFIDDYTNRRGKYESGDKEAFMFMMEEKKKNSGLVIVNGVAKIDVNGILGDGWYFDTEYSEVVGQIVKAEASDEVESIDFIIDSPGGLVSGVEEAGRAIASVAKPTRAVVKNLAASAAYWLASQADTIEATNETAQVGSIGVMATFVDYKEWDKKMGIKEIKIISSNAPDKNPDPATDKGREKYQTEINKLHEFFAKNVASGRGVTIEKVNSDFGKGGVLFANEAKEIGMIDSVSLEIEGFNNNSQEREAMVKEENKTTAEIENMITAAKEEAKAEGYAEGVTAERARVEKHLGYLGQAKNETISANLISGAKFSDSVEKYAEEKYATEEIKDRADDEPSAKVGPNGEEKPKEKDVTAMHKEMFNS